MRCRWEQADGTEAGSLKDPGRGWGLGGGCAPGTGGAVPQLLGLISFFDFTQHLIASILNKKN